jgi:hypothetical protein
MMCRAKSSNPLQAQVANRNSTMGPVGEAIMGAQGGCVFFVSSPTPFPSFSSTSSLGGAWGWAPMVLPAVGGL